MGQSQIDNLGKLATWSMQAEEKKQQQHNSVRHDYAQTNTINVNKT